MAVYRPPMPYLERQIRSIQDQTVSAWICRVGIDGHNPETEALISRLVGDDNRFTVHHFPDNVGYYRNFERLISLVRSDAAWVALADQDDAWDDDKVEVLVTELQASGCGLVACQARIVDASGTVIGHTTRREVDPITLLLDNQVTGSLSVIRPDVARAAIPFPAPTAAAFHDHWLGLVAALSGGYRILPGEHQSYVQHGANVIGEEIGARVKSRMARLLRGGPRAAVGVLADERWGWRRRMAASAVARVQEDSAAPPALRDAAAGRLTGRLASSMLRAVRDGNVAPGRAAGLLAGAVSSSLRTGRDSGRSPDDVADAGPH